MAGNNFFFKGGNCPYLEILIEFSYRVGDVAVVERLPTR